MPDSPTDLRNHPVFICGHPKAGTSLLRAVFDSHPQLVVYPEETIFFRRFAPHAEGLDLEAQLALAENELIHIFRWNREHPDPTQAGFPDRDYSAISYADVKAAMRRLVDEQHRHLGDLLSAAVLAYGQVTEQAGPERCAWVEKSPYNEFFTEQIFGWWPEARCVHILRDPRDNFASYRRKHASWQAEFFARNWRRSTLAGIGNQARYGRTRYLILRYEDLTNDPQAALQQLTSFLGIDWNPSLAAPTRAGAQWSGNSMFDDQFQGISAAPVSRWKSELSHSDAAVIEAMTAPAFQQAGYAPESRLDPYSRLRCLTWPLRSRWRKKGEG